MMSYLSLNAKPNIIEQQPKSKTLVNMGTGTFQKVVRLGLKNERSRREDRGAEGD